MPTPRLIVSLALAALLFGALGCSNPTGESEHAAAISSATGEDLSGPHDADTASADAPSSPNQESFAVTASSDSKTEIATFGAGCFWCVEAVLEQLDGVLDVSSGYMGGTTKNPTYKQVCTGTTGHAEVTQVTFDPSKIRYEQILGWFWKLHDPTTLNQQGADHGTQYRSVIFWHDEAQHQAALASKQQVEDAGVFDRPIVTEISPASTFYEAEDYHQDYYRQNKDQPYCQFVISPKLDKLGLER